MNIRVKYGPLDMPGDLELQWHPEGTLVRRFHIEYADPDKGIDHSIYVGVYFRPDGGHYFLILEDGLSDRTICYSALAMNMLATFCQWLSQNKAKVYPTKEDFLRRPETFPNFMGKKEAK